MPTDVRHEEVERRAYELYEQRGREEGRDWDDWLQAEREMLGADAEEDADTIEAEASPRRQRAERDANARAASGSNSR